MSSVSRYDGLRTGEPRHRYFKILFLAVLITLTTLHVGVLFIAEI